MLPKLIFDDTKPFCRHVIHSDGREDWSPEFRGHLQNQVEDRAERIAGCTSQPSFSETDISPFIMPELDELGRPKT